MSNGQVREICRESDSQTVYVAYYLECEMCNKKETYIAKTKGFKIRINQHISNCKTGFSTCKFHVMYSNVVLIIIV